MITISFIFRKRYRNLLRFIPYYGHYKFLSSRDFFLLQALSYYSLHFILEKLDIKTITQQIEYDSLNESITEIY